MPRRAQPIFVSSTFIDMQAERDHLRTHIFPELEERLQSRRISLEWVDLRLGIPTASLADTGLREALVLKVCLAEVQRCRPFYIFILGDCYGSIPDRDRLHAASREHGLGDIEACSVTELEIMAAVFEEAADDIRAFFYLREPLPYAEMPPASAALYSDAWKGDPAARIGVARLARLKDRILQSFPDRVRRYTAAWNAERGTLGFLEAWGRQVVEDVWRELGGAAVPAGTEEAMPPDEAQREALADFVEERTRDFCGRDELLARLIAIAALPADNGVRGICIAGDSGTGKSALFGELYRRLKQSSAPADTLVLAHSAGAGPRFFSVDALLRRWTAELAAAVGTATVLPEDPSALAGLFAELLARASQRRRVVMLLDAIDQFENTPQARYLTWLPPVLPDNARFIGTTASDEVADRLGGRAGFEMLILPPLEEAEARRIADAISARYHRVLEPAVLAALFDKRDAAGPCWRNPLWLWLAIEELNLLDGDDFARVERHYEGAAAERLRDLLLDRVKELRADIPGLYATTFTRAKALFGDRLTRAILGAIAVSRGGWRESDLRQIVPRLAEQEWDELSFSLVRRHFRGQIWQRSRLQQWDCRHDQMRTAIAQWLEGTELTGPRLHAAAANHLLDLSRGDPLRESEAMLHLINSPNPASAQYYFGDEELAGVELNHAALALVDTLIRSPGDGIKAVVRLGAAGANPPVEITAARRALYLVYDKLRERAGLETQLRLADWLVQHFKLLTQRYRQAQLANDLSACLERLAETQLARGDLEAAERAYRESLDLVQRVADENPDVQEWQRDLAVGCNKFGDIQRRWGKLAEAEEAYRKGLKLMKAVAAAESDEPEWQRDIIIGHSKIGDVRRDRKDLAGALGEYQLARGLAEALVRRQPASARWQRDLAANHDRIGDIHLAEGALAEADASFAVALAIREREAARDPGDIGWRHALALSHMRLGQLEMYRERHDAAERAAEQAASLMERTARSDPSNAVWQRELARCLRLLGDSRHSQDNLAGAEEAYRAAVARLENASDAARGDPQWRTDLDEAYEALLAIQGARGDAVGAQASIKALRRLRERGGP